MLIAMLLLISSGYPLGVPKDIWIYSTGGKSRAVFIPFCSPLSNLYFQKGGGNLERLPAPWKICHTMLEFAWFVVVI